VRWARGSCDKAWATAAKAAVAASIATSFRGRFNLTARACKISVDQTSPPDDQLACPDDEVWRGDDSCTMECFGAHAGACTNAYCVCCCVDLQSAAYIDLKLRRHRDISRLRTGEISGN
jgi:hypothetical protein